MSNANNQPKAGLTYKLVPFEHATKGRIFIAEGTEGLYKAKSKAKPKTASKPKPKAKAKK